MDEAGERYAENIQYQREHFMKKVQSMVTHQCPQSDQFQLVELKMSQNPELQIGGAEVTQCSVLAEQAQDCGQCLQQPGQPGQKARP